MKFKVIGLWGDSGWAHCDLIRKEGIDELGSKLYLSFPSIRMANASRKFGEGNERGTFQDKAN